jgi:hypothetical protein
MTDWLISANGKDSSDSSYCIFDNSYCSFGKLVIAPIRPATSADTSSARKKLKYAASCYRTDDVFSHIKNAFISEYISPTELKEVLKLNFQVNLTPGELDAVVKMFDKGGNGLVSCSDFLFWLNNMHMQIRSDQVK